jgi:PKD repeat protein
MWKKTMTICLILTLLPGILASSTSITTCQESRKIRIIDAKSGSNIIKLGKTDSPMPAGGYHFTVNVTLEGTTNKLFLYQIAVKFDRNKIRCISAQINRSDPNFVFYPYRSVTYIPEAVINNNEGYIMIGASLIGDRYVDVSKGLLCQINFTAIKITDETLIELIPTGSQPYDTFLWSNDLKDIPFTPEGLKCTIYASKTPPVPIFTFNPNNPEANQTVTFDASESYDPDGQITSYYWDLGDGNITTTNKATILHKFKIKGVYIVNLTVYDNENRYSSIRREIQVGRVPIAKFLYKPTELYPNQLVVFNASESYDQDGNIEKYVWNFGDGNITTTNKNQITHTFNNRGVFWVNLTVYDNDGLHNSTAQKIFVGKPPNPRFTYNLTTYKDHCLAAFDATQSIAEENCHIVQYVWSFGDFSDAVKTQSPKIEHIYLEEDDYNVTLTVYDNDGLYNSTSQIIKIKMEEATQPDAKTYAIIAAALILTVIVTTIVLIRRKKIKAKY